MVCILLSQEWLTLTTFSFSLDQTFTSLNNITLWKVQYRWMYTSSKIIITLSGTISCYSTCVVKLIDNYHGDLAIWKFETSNISAKSLELSTFHAKVLHFKRTKSHFLTLSSALVSISLTNLYKNNNKIPGWLKILRHTQDKSNKMKVYY